MSSDDFIATEAERALILALAEGLPDESFSSQMAALRKCTMLIRAHVASVAQPVILRGLGTHQQLIAASCLGFLRGVLEGCRDNSVNPSMRVACEDSLDRVHRLAELLRGVTHHVPADPVHVLQKHAKGCLVATAAMVLGTTYDEALKEFGGRVPEMEGFDFGEFEQVIGEHGWAVCRRWHHMRVVGRDREVWPPEPWADLHQCEVETTGNHSVLLLRDGRVLDPLTLEPKRLSDYKRVFSVAALMRLSDYGQRVSPEKRGIGPGTRS